MREYDSDRKRGEVSIHAKMWMERAERKRPDTKGHVLCDYT